MEQKTQRKFRLSFIVPVKYIKEYGDRSDFILALPHLIDKEKETEYEKAIKETGLPIWLDNGAFENKYPEGIDNLLIKAKKINAELIFSPDFWEDKTGTKRAFENFLYIAKKQRVNIKVGVVIQAKNWDEFVQFYEECINDKRVDVIGINHKTTSKIWRAKFKRRYSYDENRMPDDRIEALKFLGDKFKDKNRDVHLLGLGGGYEDVIYASKNFPWVKSNDTSAPFWSAVYGKKITEKGDFGGKIKKPLNFEYVANKVQLKLAEYNINKIKELI